MKRLTNHGFSIVEGLLVIVLIAAVGTTGYFVWKDQSTRTASISAAAAKQYKSPSVSTQPAPQINSASDLTNAYQVLNETNVNASNSDSNQLGTQTSGF